MSDAVSYDYIGLSTREGFNKSLRHFKAVMRIISDFEEHENLADILQPLLEEKELTTEQISPIVQSLLYDKYGYHYKSYNLRKNITNFDGIVSEVKDWVAVDLFLSYHHPELGVVPINPKNKEHWELVKELKKNELIVIYAGFFEKTSDQKIYKDAVELFIDLIDDKKISTPLSFKKGKTSYKKEVKQIPKKPEIKKKVVKETVKPTGKRRMTPMYSIPVTNELFHNGNVEAWKKIIQSYKAKYPDLDVYIFYEGERIHDINTLFKWGKVKHGSAILISVAGENIKDVAKLQRYLKQGASPMFEAFLKFPVNKILNLF